MGITGFGREDKAEETDWTPYLGRPVSVITNGSRVDGVVYEENMDGKYIDFLPSLVSVGDYLRLEKDLPTRFRAGGNQLPLIIRPLRDGDLEKEVEEHNSKVDREKKSEADKAKKD